MKLEFITLISGLLCSGLVQAQSNQNKPKDPCSKDYQIEDSNDLEDLPSCEKFSGNIEVTGTYIGDFALPRLENIKGNLIISASKVTSISLNKLQHVTGKLVIAGIDKINGIQFPVLTSLDELQIKEIRSDFGINFQSGLKSVNNLIIKDTQINKLQNIKIDRAISIDIAGNPELEKLDLSELTETNNNLYFIGSKKATFNAPKLLKVSGSLQLIDLDSVNISSLKSIEKKLKITQLRGKSLNAPELKEIRAGLNIEGNKNLQEVKFPNLDNLYESDIKIQENPELETIDFPKLNRVGTMDIYSGKLTKLNLNNKLTGKGTLNIKAPVDCTNINKNIIGKGFSQGRCTEIKPTKDPQDSAPPSSFANQLKFTFSSSLLSITITTLLLGLIF